MMVLKEPLIDDAALSHSLTPLPPFPRPLRLSGGNSGQKTGCQGAPQTRPMDTRA